MPENSGGTGIPAGQDQLARGVWAVLGLGRPVTIDDLQTISGFQSWEIVRYLDVLAGNGYVRLTGVARASSGEAIPQFTLVRRTGPEAPSVNENGKLVDPNLEGKSGGTVPRGLFKARVRLAAEQFHAPFASQHLRGMLKGHPESRTKKFDSIWSQLKRSGEVIRCLNPLTGAFEGWLYRPNPHVERIRSYFKKHEGDSVGSAIFKELTGMANGMIIRQALDLLTAEGFKVSVTPVKKNVVTYRVDRPAAIGEAEPDGTP